MEPLVTIVSGLSIIIPTYNREATIKRAVHSVLASPHPDLELAVVDDLSSDNTTRVLAEIDDPRLRVITTWPAGNANRARNAGVKETSSPFLAFLDSDDEFLPGRVERIVRFLEENTSVDAILDGFHVVHRGSRRPYATPFRLATGEFLVRALVSHALPITCSAIAMRRSVFDDIGGFDPDLGRHQDRDILLRLSERHLVALGTGKDVIKNQSPDSFSRSPIGYITGLDALVARHPVFLAPSNRGILGYLVARVILREIAAGHLFSAAQAIRALGRANNLPVTVFSAIANYPSGRRIRRREEIALTEHP
jgi:glycosyltransferase involved in cell wall biosynthesis